MIDIMRHNVLVFYNYHFDILCLFMLGKFQCIHLQGETCACTYISFLFFFQSGSVNRGFPGPSGGSSLTSLNAQQQVNTRKSKHEILVSTFYHYTLFLPPSEMPKSVWI